VSRVPLAVSDLWRLRRGRKAPERRAELARVPARPIGVARIEPLLEAARASGVSVEEIDAEHVRLRYDAREHDQFVAIDNLYDATHDQGSLEGDGKFETSPNNWMVIHFDYATCGTSFEPD
jgi:pyrroloquinoline quinone (PQQ) biosynthesis protein C